MPEFADLLEHLELPQCHCLNSESEHPLRHCLDAENRDNPATFLRSDSDEELLITLKFMQAVKVSAIGVRGADGAMEGAPSSLKLFVNKVGLDFDSAKADKPTQELTVTKADAVSGAKIDVRFVNFQGVQELGIFIGGNLGDEEQTTLSRLVIFGEPVQHTGVKRCAAAAAALAARARRARRHRAHAREPPRARSLTLAVCHSALSPPLAGRRSSRRRRRRAIGLGKASPNPGQSRC
jgi:hypothetical protein